MIEFQCVACGKRYRVPDESAGKRGGCKKCGASLLVPDVADDTFSLIEVDPPRIRPSVSYPPTPLPDAAPIRPTPSRDVPRAPKGVSPLGVVSFALGSASLVWAGTEGYHPPAWSLAQLALFLGVVSLFGALGPRGTASGWPIAGVLASLLGLGFCNGMEKRAIRAAREEAYARAIEVERMAKVLEDQQAQFQRFVPDDPGEDRDDDAMPADGDTAVGPRIATPADVGREAYFDLGGQDVIFLCRQMGPDGPFDSKPELEVPDGTRVLILSVRGRFAQVRYTEEDDGDLFTRVGWTTLDWIRVDDSSVGAEP